MSLIALALLAAPTPAPAAPAPPRSGQVSALIHSETFRRAPNGKPQPFRVDYTASLNWALVERKACLVGRCRTVCDLTISHKVLSRQLWWTPAGQPPILAENTPAQREYFGGVVNFNRTCASVGEKDVARGANDRLRPYQFADEMIKDRAPMAKAADDYLALNPPPP